MRSYGQYCPIARGAEIFATRWTPIIVRNILLGCRTYGEIAAGAPGIPRALLSERLRQLEDARDRPARAEPARPRLAVRADAGVRGPAAGVRRARPVGRHLGRDRARAPRSVHGVVGAVPRHRLPPAARAAGDDPVRAAARAARAAAVLDARAPAGAGGVREAAGLRRRRGRAGRCGVARALGARRGIARPGDEGAPG